MQKKKKYHTQQPVERLLEQNSAKEVVHNSKGTWQWNQSMNINILYSKT